MYYSNQISQAYNTGYNQGSQQGRESATYLAYQSGYNAGFVNGCNGTSEDGLVVPSTGYNIRDPTYGEMKAFLAADQTDMHEYDVDGYNCVDYSKDVCNNAFNAGYRCGFVYIELSGPYAHVIVCFNTTDCGIIFIEPQYDCEVTLEIGESYGSNPQSQSSDDIIMSYDIIW